MAPRRLYISIFEPIIKCPMKLVYQRQHWMRREDHFKGYRNLGLPLRCAATCRHFQARTWCPHPATWRCFPEHCRACSPPCGIGWCGCWGCACSCSSCGKNDTRAAPWAEGHGRSQCAVWGSVCWRAVYRRYCTPASHSWWVLGAPGWGCCSFRRTERDRLQT